MSYRTRFVCWSLILTLSCHGPASALLQPASALPAGQHATDETALRALAEAFNSAWAAQDLEGYVRLWSAQAPGKGGTKKRRRNLLPLTPESR